MHGREAKSYPPRLVSAAPARLQTSSPSIETDQEIRLFCGLTMVKIREIRNKQLKIRLLSHATYLGI